MIEKDNKEKLKELLKNMGMAFTDADEIVEKSKTTVKKSSDVK
jgi:hypothetical protein